MGTFTVKLQVCDPQGRRCEEIDALVGSSATFTTIPASILRRLGVEPKHRANFRLANGVVEQRDIGVTMVRVKGEESIGSVVFGGEDRALLGAVTLEDLLLTVDPFGKRLIHVEGFLPTSECAMPPIW